MESRPGLGEPWVWLGGGRAVREKGSGADVRLALWSPVWAQPAQPSQQPRGHALQPQGGLGGHRQQLWGTRPVPSADRQHPTPWGSGICLAPTDPHAGEDGPEVRVVLAFGLWDTDPSLVASSSVFCPRQILFASQAAPAPPCPQPRTAPQLALDLAIPTSCPPCPGGQQRAHLGLGGAPDLLHRTGPSGPGRLCPGGPMLELGLPLPPPTWSLGPGLPPLLSKLQRGGRGGGRREGQGNWLHPGATWQGAGAGGVLGFRWAPASQTSLRGLSPCETGWGGAVPRP
ncbi:hypothetical protein HJG60_007735 [Phyllostomus discolor]|uniref:Uncharacterized protein n=1 Tax=Phyllostomus discolor TaxID=89673 RepID=A0A834BI31_9CHIR|nr:hypothetical protein HJG60_007735 [Phyllostomus discolor]